MSYGDILHALVLFSLVHTHMLLAALYYYVHNHLHIFDYNNHTYCLCADHNIYTPPFS